METASILWDVQTEGMKHCACGWVYWPKRGRRQCQACTLKGYAAKRAKYRFSEHGAAKHKEWFADNRERMSVAFKKWYYGPKGQAAMPARRERTRKFAFKTALATFGITEETYHAMGKNGWLGPAKSSTFAIERLLLVALRNPKPQ